MSRKQHNLNWCYWRTFLLFVRWVLSSQCNQTGHCSLEDYKSHNYWTTEQNYKQRIIKLVKDMFTDGRAKAMILINVLQWGTACKRLVRFGCYPGNTSSSGQISRTLHCFVLPQLKGKSTLTPSCRSYFSVYIAI